MFELFQDHVNDYVGPYQVADVINYLTTLIHDLQAQRNSGNDVMVVQALLGKMQKNLALQVPPPIQISVNAVLKGLGPIAHICVKWAGRILFFNTLRTRFQSAVTGNVVDGNTEKISRKLSKAEHDALVVNHALVNDHEFCIDNYKWVHDETNHGANVRALSGAPTHFVIWNVRRGTIAALRAVAVDEERSGARVEEPPVLFKPSAEPGAFGIHEEVLGIFNASCVLGVGRYGTLGTGGAIPR